MNRYAYWLIIDNRSFFLECGVNDRITFNENKSENYHHEIPVTSILQEGWNTVYFRFFPNARETQQGSLKISLHILELGTQNKETIELLSITSSDTEDNKVQANVDYGSEVITLDKDIKEIGAISSQGKGVGYQLPFIIKDNFYPQPYVNGNIFLEGTALKEKVKKSLRNLLMLYQKKDYHSIISAYEKSWAHIAKSYDYGEDARSYADDVDFESDLDYQFFLDFSRSKLRIEAEGRLVGYHPPPLVGLRKIQGENSLEIIYCPVFFMLNDEGELQIAG